MTKEYVLKDIGMKSTFNIKPNYNIIFHCGNTQIGVLDFNGPEMTFSGDMDESAKLFLEFIATSFKARLEQERAVGYREGHQNALKQMAQPEQPKVRTGDCLLVGVCASEGHKIAPQRKPLTDEEIQDALLGYRLVDAIDIARAIESAHGIKE